MARGQPLSLRSAYRNRVAATKLVRRKTLEPIASKGRRGELLAWAWCWGIGPWHCQIVSFGWRYFESLRANYG